MEYKDYYKILGVKKNASQDEIKRAYRKLSRKYHPDISKEKDAEQKFKEVGEAYEVLKDLEKRSAYDQLGTGGWQPGQEFRPPPGWQDFSFNFDGFGSNESGGFSDFFESLFGDGLHRTGSFRSGGSNVHLRGDDVQARISIDLEDAFRGATRTLSLQIPEVSPDNRQCLREKNLQVKIPKGITEGQQIRLQGQGDPAPGEGKNGDLYLEVNFRPHPYYRVDGKDLYLNLPVAPWEAALGGKVKVPTPGGLVDLQIPAGAQSGKKLRLKGRGLPGNQAGDLYVVLQIQLPPADNKKAKSFYQKMAHELAFNPRAELEG